jgi:threonine synthase
MRTTKDAVADAPAVFDTVAVSIGTTRSAFQALKALRESQGVAVTVGNSGLIELQAEVAAMEGVFAELASITPFAAIASLRQRELIKSSDSVVAIATASGLKDLDRSVRHSQPAPVFLSAADAMNHLQRREETCVVAPEEA